MIKVFRATGFRWLNYCCIFPPNKALSIFYLYSITKVCKKFLAIDARSAFQWVSSQFDSNFSPLIKSVAQLWKNFGVIKFYNLLAHYYRRLLSTVLALCNLPFAMIEESIESYLWRGKSPRAPQKMGKVIARPISIEFLRISIEQSNSAKWKGNEKSHSPA